MSQLMKTLLLVLALLYFISPIDACPGLIDDAIFLVFAAAAQRRSALPKE
ncbi:MAG: hypothetical protein J6M58_03065 [Clostridium sp.]|nr:hypothetical protein [Clostridium sp.]